ncbi:hypothetical protein SE17_29280, partial [Kouleothrix aurantiaca]
MNTMLESFTRPPDLDNVEVGQTVLGAGLVAGTLPSLLLMTLDIDIIHNRPVYATLLAIYITLLLSLIVRTRITLWLWRHLWAYLLVLSLVCLAVQSQIAESFLQPFIFIPLLVQAALIYPPGRVALVALWLLGLMNLGILLGGQQYAPALLLPTFGYGT